MEIVQRVTNIDGYVWALMNKFFSLLLPLSLCLFHNRIQWTIFTTISLRPLTWRLKKWFSFSLFMLKMANSLCFQFHSNAVFFRLSFQWIHFSLVRHTRIELNRFRRDLCCAEHAMQQLLLSTHDFSHSSEAKETSKKCFKCNKSGVNKK